MLSEAEEREIWKKLGLQRERDHARALELERVMGPWLRTLRRWAREMPAGRFGRRMLKAPSCPS